MDDRDKPTPEAEPASCNRDTARGDQARGKQFRAQDDGPILPSHHGGAGFAIS